MTNKSDPTLTLTLRKRTVSECNARFDRVRRAVVASFSLGDYSDKPWPFSDPILTEELPITPQEGGILVNAAKPRKKKPKAGYKRPAYKLKSVTGAPSLLGPSDTPTGYVYQSVPGNVARFDKWLDSLINKEILEPSVQLPNKWLSRVLGTAYDKGSRASRSSIAKQLASSKNGLLPNHPFSNPAHIERAKLVYQRAFNDMEGVTSTMKTQMRRILSDGIMRGQNPNEIGDLMADRINKIGKVRGRLIARTEIIRAHQEAAMEEARQLEAETGYTINMEWDGRDDGRERPSHVARNGKIYTKEVAATLIGEPNCRCSLNPHVVV
jgi:SPP1 gp7 family putative phage head morphogenesis protein